MMKCCVVIPIHSLDMIDVYKASIINTMNVLSAHDIFLMCPQSLVFDNRRFFHSTKLKVYRIEDKWMSSDRMYNKLCMQHWLYKSFDEYDYMLIVQSDAWIFSDQLEHWCSKGYDYIGAPWCENCNEHKNCKYQSSPIDGKPIIGNGGLSLRKVAKFIEVTKIIEDDVNAIPDDKIPNEDIYLMSSNKVSWNVPTCAEAIHFSIETLAQFHVDKGIIPFGCHNLLKIHPIAFLKLHFIDHVLKLISMH